MPKKMRRKQIKTIPGIHGKLTQADLDDIDAALDFEAQALGEGFSMDFDDFPTADINYTVETAIEPAFYVATLTLEHRVPLEAMPVIRAKADRARQFDRAAR